MSQEEKNIPVEQQRLEKEQIEDMGSVYRTRGAHAIHCLTVIGQVEGHVEAPQGRRPQNMSTSSPSWWPCRRTRHRGPAGPAQHRGRGCGGGACAGGAHRQHLQAQCGVVLGGGHSIGIPLAVSAQRSFIVPTATMTVHPVRHSGMILGVPQTMRWFEQMQERITGFVASHSGISEKRYTELMMRTGELVMDVGTVLDGRKAVREKLIDELGGLSDALVWLYREIEGK